MTFDVIGLLPVVGEIGDTGKLIKNSGKIIDDIVDVPRISSKLSKQNKVISSISPTELIKTHNPTLSNKQYKKLVDDIRKNGITETIKYVEHNGNKYVVDGHHRLRAAKELGIKNVPAEKVSLPYLGYKLIKDLLWLD